MTCDSLATAPPPSIGVPVCQVCGEKLDDGRPVVACERCGTPHHAECWSYVGTCSTFACGTAATRRVDSRDGVPSPDGGAAVVIGDSGAGFVAGHRIPLPLPARPRVILHDVEGRSLDTSDSLTRLDLDTPLERGLQYGSVLALASSIALLTLPPSDRPLTASLLLGLSVALMALRLGVQCTYVLDNESRQILYSLSLFGLGQTWEVAPFDDVRAVGVTGRFHSTEPDFQFLYAVLIELPGGVRVTVSDETFRFDLAQGFARSLAHHLGASLVEARPFDPNMGEPVGTVPMWPRAPGLVHHPAWGRTRTGWILWFLFTLVVFVLSRR